MRWSWLALALGACGGPFSGARLESLAESQRRALVTVTFPALERADSTMRGSGGDPEAAPLRRLLFGLYGLGVEAARDVATELPVGIGVAGVEAPGPQGPTAVNAVAFALRESVSTREWLESLGDVRARSGPFVLVAQSERVLGMYRRRSSGTLFFHVDGNQLILSNTLGGLLVAGPAARAARHGADGDLVMNVRPPVWGEARLRALAQDLAGFTELLRRGRASAGSPLAETLAAAAALYDLHPFAAARSADVVLKVGAAGAELRVRTDGPDEPAPALPLALDTALVEPEVAALGALDCRRRMSARQRMLNAAWQAAGKPGARELEALVDAEQAALAGSCSFAVHTRNETWSDEASYLLRPKAQSAALLAAFTAAIRSGGWSGLHSATDDLVTEKLLFTTDRDALVALRALGAMGSPQTRHAAALYGTSVLQDRFAVRDGRLLAVSGADAGARLEELSTVASPPQPLPAELDRALASGRGKAGFLFLDLTALWRPFLKAAQVIQSPLADLVARNPALVKQPRPLVITLERSSALDATVTMPRPTFEFLVEVAGILFAG
jgi:hypothetical protein